MGVFEDPMIDSHSRSPVCENASAMSVIILDTELVPENKESVKITKRELLFCFKFLEVFRV